MSRKAVELDRYEKKSHRLWPHLKAVYLNYNNKRLFTAITSALRFSLGVILCLGEFVEITV